MINTRTAFMREVIESSATAEQRDEYDIATTGQRVLIVEQRDPLPLRDDNDRREHREAAARSADGLRLDVIYEFDDGSSIDRNDWSAAGRTGAQFEQHRAHSHAA